VYFRKRSHDARVAIKRLRYALELADMTGGWRLPRALRTLRKAQDALGQAHDREVLLARLEDLRADRVAVPDGDAALIEQFLTREIDELHSRYLAARSDIRDISDRCEGTVRVERRHIQAVAATTLAIPVVLALRRR
jgi:CHAD domain-containing protein